jgi:NAD(P)-dependent dehydrogenase (short-subunit alcohol dehydrogenase family)
MNDVVVVVGAGSIGQAIARRVSAGKKVLLADLRHENADAAAKTLSDAGFDVSTVAVDVSSSQSVETQRRANCEIVPERHAGYVGVIAERLNQRSVALSGLGCPL